MCFSSCRAGEAQRLDFEIQNIPVDSLSMNNRRILGAGFVDVLKDYEHRMAWIGPTYVILRISVGLSLLSLLYTTTIDSKIVSLVLSIAAVLSHIGREYFSIDKRYLSTLSITTRLKLEGWDFVTLGGAYAHPTQTQDDCIQEFMETVRMLRTQYLNDTMMAVREGGAALKAQQRTSMSGAGGGGAFLLANTGQPKTAGAPAGKDGARGESKSADMPPAMLQVLFDNMMERYVRNAANKAGDLGERGPLPGLITPTSLVADQVESMLTPKTQVSAADAAAWEHLSTQLVFPSARPAPRERVGVPHRGLHSVPIRGDSKEESSAIQVVVEGGGDDDVEVETLPEPHASPTTPTTPTTPHVSGQANQRPRLPTHLASPSSPVEP